MRQFKTLGFTTLVAFVGSACEAPSDDVTDNPTFRSAQVIENGWNIGNGIFQIGNGIFQIGNGIFQIGNGIFQIGNGIFQIGNGTTLSYNESLAQSTFEPGVLDDHENHKFVQFLVECALEEGDTITFDGHTFTGYLGLAPQWSTHPLDDNAEQEWLTACMIARVNTGGSSVPLAFIADHPNIGTDLVAGYQLPEAAFYGNFFSDPPELYHCMMPGGLESATFANHRTCGSAESDCGFTWTGNCADVCTMGGVDYTGDDAGDIPSHCVGGGREFQTIGVMLNDDAPLAWGYLGRTNLSSGQRASQSTTWKSYKASLAVDGDTHGNLVGGSVSRTVREGRPWWQVDLEAEQCVTGVKIHHRTGEPTERVRDATLYTRNEGVWRAIGKLGDDDKPIWSVPLPATNAQGFALRYDDVGTPRHLALAEVELMGTEGPCSQWYLTIGPKTFQPAYALPDQCVKSIETRRGTDVRPTTCTFGDDPQQDWEMYRLESGNVEIWNVGSEMCLGSAGETEGSPIELSDCDGSGSQQWEFVPMDNGWYGVINLETGWAMTVSDRPGRVEKLVQSEWSASPRQLFSINTAFADVSARVSALTSRRWHREHDRR